MKKDWKLLESDEKYRDSIIRVVHKEFFYGPASGSMPFTVVEMSSWATIVPRCSDGGFLLVRQFRAGPEDDTLEFPGGSIEPGETPAETARRELAEETGAEAEKITPLGIMDPNPAFMSNKCHVFLAEGAEITGPLKTDRFEDARAIKVSEEEFFSMVRDGRFRQSLSLAAAGLYLVSGFRK